MVEKEQARELFCPYKAGTIKCKVEQCMAWEDWESDPRYGYCKPAGRGKTPPKPPKVRPPA